MPWTPEQKQRMKALRKERDTAIQEVVVMEGTLEQIVHDARDEGTLDIPKSGEPWDADRNYVTGDTAMEGKTLYIAQKYNKGKLPSKFKQHWTIST